MKVQLQQTLVQAYFQIQYFAFQFHHEDQLQLKDRLVKIQKLHQGFLNQIFILAAIIPNKKNKIIGVRRLACINCKISISNACGQNCGNKNQCKIIQRDESNT